MKPHEIPRIFQEITMKSPIFLTIFLAAREIRTFRTKRTLRSVATNWSFRSRRGEDSTIPPPWEMARKRPNLSSTGEPRLNFLGFLPSGAPVYDS